TFVTMKRPFAWRGALLNACSAVNQSRGVSSRKTLKIGSACAAGSTWLTSTSVNFSAYFNTSPSCFWKSSVSASVRFSRASLATYATSRSEVFAIVVNQPRKLSGSKMQMAHQPDDHHGNRDYQNQKQQPPLSSLFAKWTPPQRALAVIPVTFVLRDRRIQPAIARGSAYTQFLLLPPPGDPGRLCDHA